MMAHRANKDPKQGLGEHLAGHSSSVDAPSVDGTPLYLSADPRKLGGRYFSQVLVRSRGMGMAIYHEPRKDVHGESSGWNSDCR